MRSKEKLTPIEGLPPDLIDPAARLSVSSRGVVSGSTSCADGESRRCDTCGAAVTAVACWVDVQTGRESG